ncbi:MAG: ABC transporter ATP-binding protein/permease [Eubacterium sp.]|nr:ABC transporter ATP-binding protein/permease [Eubacterium sp.]
MKKIVSFLKDYKKESILAPLFKMLEAIFELIVPLVMAAIIDVGIAGSDKQYVIRMCLVMVGLGVVGLACSITAQFFAAKAAVGMATKLRHAVFSHIQSLSFSQIDQIGTSTLITRMTSDINQVQAGINLFLRLFLRSPFIVFGAMVMAFTVDVRAAMIFVVTIPLLSIVVFGVMCVSIPLYKKVQSGLDQVLALVRENLTGVRVIRAFQKEEEEISNFQKKNQVLNEGQQYVGKISALTNPVTYVIINAATLVLIWTGAVRVDNGYITQGEVVALVNYMSQILVELIKLANLIVSVTKAIACGKRVADVLSIDAGLPEPQNGAAGAADMPQDAAGAARSKGALPKVSFSGVSMAYHGSGEYAVSDIQFQAYPGETIGIIGGTGSGKSTVVNLIPRFYDVSKGVVQVDGADVRSYEPAALRSKIGMVMQKAVLFKGTIRENLKWGNEDATEEQLMEAIEAAQAADVIQAKELGLDEMVEQGGKNLSGGQRQRLTIARALVRRPQILILDDSASALDFATDARLRASLRALDYKPTVFIVSQRTSSVQSADCILVLDDGEMVGKGTHEQLLESCSVYQEIYASQFRSEGSTAQAGKAEGGMA